MATYVLIHGASSDSWYWHRVVPELRRLGHDVVAPDLPSDDDAAGPEEYADTVSHCPLATMIRSPSSFMMSRQM